MLDFRNNKIKRRSTLDSILERMTNTDYSMKDASGRLMWEPSDIPDGPLEARITWLTTLD